MDEIERAPRLFGKLISPIVLTIIDRWRSNHPSLSEELSSVYGVNETLATFVVAIIGVGLFLYNVWQKYGPRRVIRADLKKRIEETLQKDVHKCPICLSDAKYPVLTDCGHIFCCACIIQHWKRSKPIEDPCDCAMCRCTFFKLLRVRWRPPRTPDDQLQEIITELEDYNRRFSSRRPPLDFNQDISPRIPHHFLSYFHKISDWIHDARTSLFGLYSSGILPEDMYKMHKKLDDRLLLFLVIAVLVREILRKIWSHVAERRQANQDQ